MRRPAGRNVLLWRGNKSLLSRVIPVTANIAPIVDAVDIRVTCRAWKVHGLKHPAACSDESQRGVRSEKPSGDHAAVIDPIWSSIAVISARHIDCRICAALLEETVQKNRKGHVPKPTHHLPFIVNGVGIGGGRLRSGYGEEGVRGSSWVPDPGNVVKGSVTSGVPDRSTSVVDAVPLTRQVIRYVGKHAPGTACDGVGDGVGIVVDVHIVADDHALVVRCVQICAQRVGVIHGLYGAVLPRKTVSVVIGIQVRSRD